MFEWIELFSNSIIAGALLSIAIGIIGSLMLINRYNYLAASIAHGSYGGIGLALYFGISILLGATLFALILALFIAFITSKYPQRKDVLIGTIWAVGMSIGIVFVDLTPGYNVDLLSFLFGDILMVPKEDLFYMGFVDIILIISIILFYNIFLAIAYDRDFLKLRGVNVEFFHYLLLILIALTVVMSIRSVGLILIIALFSIPPFIAEKFTISLKSMILLSSIISFVFIIFGLYISYIFNISATASIILTLAALFIIIFLKGKK
ncbi:metal ABC transporter permease [Nitrosophilus kaiyonis]|uniref:metal ABC transporter permease n=1 Tax=Nitrosophilus kaiyonis TaxID=2930200 RepID=UPI002492C480|nr:metal ABC transporter permease [Nitrosophilus kaiyonis]